MDSNSFKRNVLRTVSPRLAKVGLRDIASNNQTTNLLHGIAGLNAEVGGLMENLNPYLLGFQLNNDLLQSAFMSLGGVSYYAVLLAKATGVKVPGSGKKVRMTALTKTGVVDHNMTKTEAILHLNKLANDMQYEAMAAFRGEPINVEATADLVEQFLGTLWPTTYDLLGVTPSQVFEAYNERLAAGFPEGLFGADKEAVKAALVALKGRESNLIASRKAQKEQAREAKKAANAQKKAAAAAGSQA
jgi:hypothetical protein